MIMGEMLRDCFNKKSLYQVFYVSLSDETIVDEVAGYI